MKPVPGKQSGLCRTYEGIAAGMEAGVCCDTCRGEGLPSVHVQVQQSDQVSLEAGYYDVVGEFRDFGVAVDGMVSLDPSELRGPAWRYDRVRLGAYLQVGEGTADIQKGSLQMKPEETYKLRLQLYDFTFDIS